MRTLVKIIQINIFITLEIKSLQRSNECLLKGGEGGEKQPNLSKKNELCGVLTRPIPSPPPQLHGSQQQRW